MNRRRFLVKGSSLAGLAGLVHTTGLRGLVVAAQAPAHRYTPTHFASPAGAGRHDGSKGNEWTLAEAYENAAAGSRVQFAPGTYTTHSGRARTQASTPKNNGTAGSPIVFFAEHPAVYHLKNPERHTTWVSDGNANGRGSVTGHAERVSGGHYVVWDGISMRQINGAWSGGELGVVSLFDGQELNVKFLRCLFDQLGQGQLEPQNNWGAVFIQQTSGIEFGDCVFQNIPGSRGDENAQPIVAYASGNLEVHHCEFRNNNGSGLWLKGVQVGSSHDNRPVRLHHCLHTGFTSRAIGFGAVGQGDYQKGQFCDVFQNVFHPGKGSYGISVSWRDLSGGSAPRNVRMVNNTFVGEIPHEGGEEAFHRVHTITDTNDIWRDCQFRNNIIQYDGVNVAYIHVQYGNFTEASFKKMVIDHNCYSSGFRNYAGMDFGQWRRLGQDANTHVGNARLRNATDGDARLEPNSPVRAGGSKPGLDVLNLLGKGETGKINMGAYITEDMSDTIGIRPEAVTNALPLSWKWPFA